MGRDGILLLMVSLIVVLRCANGAGLSDDFYKKSCPKAEQIVRNITWNRAASNSVLGAKLLRMHFHDCFVRGCDGSILLDGDGESEKDTIPNGSLSGYDVIDDIKDELERVCPGVVSCADILALAARDSVSFQSWSWYGPFNRTVFGPPDYQAADHPYNHTATSNKSQSSSKPGFTPAYNFQWSLWKVQTGRRDGSISLASEANANLPSPFADFETLKQQFSDKNLNVNDLVVLSGAHTLGVAHCATFSTRLYEFSEDSETDPSLNSTYVEFLKTQCPNPASHDITVELDPQSSLSFDKNYFSILLQNKGLLQSDAALLTDQESAKIVSQLQQHSYSFFIKFEQSMKKMGAIEVLTGTNGEIRKNCRRVNPSQN